MNDDPLIIIKQEIAQKKKEYDLEIKILEDKKANLKNQIESYKSEHEEQVKILKEKHESLINDANEKFSKQKNAIQEQFNIFKEKRNNKLLADSLLEQSNLEQQSQEFQNEIHNLNLETQKFIDDKTKLYQDLLLPFQDSIEFDKNRIEEIQREIKSIQNSKLPINKIDKIRRGPKVTYLDAKITEKEHEIYNYQLSFISKTDKFEKSFERKKVLSNYELSKLRQSIKEAKQKQIVFLSKIEEEKQIFKIEMTKLKMKLVDLTDPKPFPVPKKKIDRSKKIRANKETSIEINSLLETKNKVLNKLKLTQSDLLRKIRKLNWILSNPTDVTYTRISSFKNGIES